MSYAKNQFYKINEVEPVAQPDARNPRFLWPSSNYMDSAGNSGKIQRGYMRSLITDPAVLPENDTTPNRRLFFQFNPQVLVRSVQQSVGSMLPLLQDPAQLIQPVPGTTSFGFELMFNREHEVNAGYNDPKVDYLRLPNGDRALVSEIGVLADLMILDSITGQGISQDMINSVTNAAKRQYKNINDYNEKRRQELIDAGIDEKTLDFQELDVPQDQELKDIFEANFGNSAFLNPLPFRVLFSSLFMIEGVATSVDVVFQKFSRTMVPTQCKVTINMYALYLGFAKDRTFIFDNLKQVAETESENRETDENVEEMVLDAVTTYSGRLSKSGSGLPVVAPNNPTFEVNNIKTSAVFQEYLKKDITKEENFAFYLDYFFTSTPQDFSLDKDGNLVVGKEWEDLLLKSRTELLQNGTKKLFNAKGTRKVEGLRALKNGKTIFQDQITITRPSSTTPAPEVYTTVNPYIYFRVVMEVQVVSPSGNTITKQLPGTLVQHQWANAGNSPISAYEHTPQRKYPPSRIVGES